MTRRWAQLSRFRSEKVALRKKAQDQRNKGRASFFWGKVHVVFGKEEDVEYKVGKGKKNTTGDLKRKLRR